MEWLFIGLALAFIVVLYRAVPWLDVEHRFFFPLYGFGQFVRLGTLFNWGIGIAVVSILIFSAVSPDHPVGGGGEGALIRSFQSWLWSLIFFHFIGRRFIHVHPYEIYWRGQLRSIDLYALFERWLIRLLLFIMLREAVGIFA